MQFFQKGPGHYVIDPDLTTQHNNTGIYGSLGWALNQASTRCVELVPGTHQMNGTLTTSNNGVMIRGAGECSRIYYQRSANDTILHIQGNDTILDNFRIDEGRTSYISYSDPCIDIDNVSNCIVKNCFFTGITGENVIKINGGDYCKVFNNFIDSWTNRSVYSLFGIDAMIYNNIINSRYGVAIVLSSNPVNGIIVTRNIINMHANARAIWAGTSAYPNVICKNMIKYSGSYGPTSNSALSVAGYSVAARNFIEANWTSNTNGIIVSASNNLVMENRIRYFSYGVWKAAVSSGYVMYNLITNCSSGEVYNFNVGYDALCAMN